MTISTAASGSGIGAGKSSLSKRSTSACLGVSSLTAHSVPAGIIFLLQAHQHFGQVEYGKAEGGILDFCSTRQVRGNLTHPHAITKIALQLAERLCMNPVDLLLGIPTRRSSAPGNSMTLMHRIPGLNLDQGIDGRSNDVCQRAPDR
jgi:hypothetical protein